MILRGGTTLSEQIKSRNETEKDFWKIILLHTLTVEILFLPRPWPILICSSSWDSSIFLSPWKPYWADSQPKGQNQIVTKHISELTEFSKTSTGEKKERQQNLKFIFCPWWLWWEGGLKGQCSHLVCIQAKQVEKMNAGDYVTQHPAA